MFRPFLHFGIGVLILSLLVRTWIAMGLIVPVVVSAGSMAPHLVGPHRDGRCMTCQNALKVGLEYASPRQTLACPHCGRGTLAGELTPRAGEAIWVNLLAYLHRPPRRWEPIVFRCPDRASSYCIKRVVGLPGEAISLREGDVYADGRIVRKTLAQQLAFRIPVHRESAAAIGWHTGKVPSNWLRDEAGWHSTGSHGTASDDPLSFEPPSSWPLTDDYFYNAKSFVAAHTICDVMFCCEVVCRDEATLRVRWADDRHTWSVVVTPHAGQVELLADERVVAVATDPDGGEPSSGRRHDLLISRFDLQTLVAIDDTTWLQVPDRTAGKVRAQGPLRSLAIDVGGTGVVTVADLRVFRDVFYTAGPWQIAPGTTGPTLAVDPSWSLGPDEWFVLGDNSPVSDDSRSWKGRPGLDAKLILGKPLRPLWRRP